VETHRSLRLGWPGQHRENDVTAGRDFARSFGHTAVLAVVVACLFDVTTAVKTHDVAATVRVAGAGASAWAALIQGTDGSLYKTASAGGSAWDRAVAAPIDYCPNDAVTRAQMAVFLLRVEHGQGYAPPVCTGVFQDVPCPGGFAVDWIEQLHFEGVTGGCSTNPPLYCPELAVTRAQMAVFLLEVEHGSSYTPPACAAPGIFGDVSCPGGFAVDWIEQLSHEGITGGCSASPLLYCPDQAVTRAQMAVFLLRGEHGSSYTPPACAPPGIFQDVPCTATGTAPVTVGNIFFSPSAVTATVGDTVKWTWNSAGTSHSTTSGACSPNCMPDGHWDSGVHSSPNTFSFTFTSAGTYPYHCSVHLASMTGTVQVNAPAFAVNWIEQLYAEGITGGCGLAPPTPTPTPPPPTTTPRPTTTRYYPGAHGQVAVHLTEALDLP
jgi:plastocyanin